MNIRKAIKWIVAATIVAATAGATPQARAATANDAAFWSRPRCVDLVRAGTDERIRDCYHDGKALDPAGHSRISWFLRDRRAGRAVAMDPAVLDILVAVHAWARHRGHSGPIVIHSGYRTPETNAMLEGAARGSLHMRGMAIDLSIPGLRAADVGVLAAWFRGGGVGFYPESGFTHIDSGGVRYWGNAPRMR